MSDNEEAGKATTQAEVKDPVCGMIVDPAKARGRAQHRGQTYFFCSPGCMHRFVSDPGKYLAISYKAGALTDTVHIGDNCQIAKDPVCGMNVDPAKAVSTAEFERELYHFCSKGCAEKFRDDPQKYLSAEYEPAGMAGMVTIGGPGKTTFPVQSRTGKLQRDPVCGMNVDPAKAAATFAHKGTTYYFCCKGCSEKFQADPEKYLAKGTAAAQLTTIAPAKTAPAATSPATMYVCPMDPEVRASKPGACPKCGMALEPDMPVAATRTQWTCPMHPEIVRDRPGFCPICGMALEPMTVTAAEEENPELRDMTRRFWWSVALGIPLVAFAMLRMGPAERLVSPALGNGIEFLLATPIVLWCGWPFFQRGWASVKFRSPNMFTLIAMGVGVAYMYSAVATLVPQLFPPSLRTMHGMPRGLLRSGRGDHRARVAGAGIGAACPQPHQQCHSCSARSLAQAGAHHARRRQRIRRSARAGEGRRQAAGASRRKDSHRRHGARRPERG